MSGGEIVVLCVIGVIVCIALLCLIISMVAFPTESSRVPPLPIKRKRGIK